MKKFLTNNWKILTLSALALLAAAAVVAAVFFFPPAIFPVIYALANTSLFAMMGAAAMPVAIATTAALAAASIYAIGGIVAGINWASHRIAEMFSKKKPADAGAGDNANADADANANDSAQTPDAAQNVQQFSSLFSRPSSPRVTRIMTISDNNDSVEELDDSTLRSDSTI